MSNALAQAVKNSGKMGTGAKIGITFVVIALIVGIGLLIAWAVNPDLFKMKQEGDECEGDDVRGTYEIDEDGKCTLISCETGWEVDGKTCVKTVVPDVPSPDPVVTEFPSPIYEQHVLKVPKGGVTMGPQYDYGDQLDCETQCSMDDACVGVSYTDTTASSVADGACWKLVEGTGPIGYDTHTHYSTSLKTVDTVEIFENPKFTGKSTPILTGTPWENFATGWDTFMSSTAHPQNYLSWHPFDRSSKNTWASFTAADEHVGIKYPGPVVLKGYAVSSTSNQNNYIPGKIVIEGSSDGTNWTVIKEHTTPSGKAGYSKNKTVTLAYESLPTNENAFSQYRVRIPAGGHYNNITDFKLFTTLSAA